MSHGLPDRSPEPGSPSGPSRVLQSDGRARRGPVWCFPEHVLCTALSTLGLHHAQTPLLSLESFSPCARRLVLGVHLEVSPSVSCSPLRWLPYCLLFFVGFSHVTHTWHLVFWLFFSHVLIPLLGLEAPQELCHLGLGLEVMYLVALSTTTQQPGSAACRCCLERGKE